LEQLERAHRFGFRVPKTLISQEPATIRRFWKECNGSVIVKPLSSGYIERTDDTPDTLIYTNALRPEDLAHNAEIRRCPSLLQEAVRKQSDIRVNVVDGNVEAAELCASDSGTPRLDIRRNNMADVTYRQIALPRQLVRRILRFVRSYGLRFSAIDLLRHTDGEYIFLELNPNGQWAWLDQAGVTKTREHLITALKRR
jgi:glutathione synthase/RimK-type ligase-like ATP-grasp enzyme